MLKEIWKRGNLLNFLKAFLVFVDMYRCGFYPSRNTHYDKNGDYWGFFRINHKDDPSLFDIDFNFEYRKNRGYYHVHGEDTRRTLIR